MNSNIETIYVELLDEGTDVARPTTGRHVKNDVYELLASPNYDPEIETWEFIPGTKVHVVEEMRENQVILIARREFSE